MSRMRSILAIVGAVQLACASGAITQSAPSLDYDFFKGRIESIFLTKRPGHTRCYVCHEESNNAFRLEKLTPGSSFWLEEQSRRNFAVVSTLVVPGNPGDSRLLLHPLAPEGGGNVFHSGGRQFASKNDPDWKLLMQWVNGAKLAAPSKK